MLEVHGLFPPDCPHGFPSPFSPGRERALPVELPRVIPAMKYIHLLYATGCSTIEMQLFPWVISSNATSTFETVANARRADSRPPAGCSAARGLNPEGR